MKSILLFGNANGGNWLPLIFPIIAIILFIKFVEVIVRYFKKKKASHTESAISEITYFINDEEPHILIYEDQKN